MLAVVVADERERAEEVLPAKDGRDEPHLADRAFGRRRVGVLDDPDEAPAVADDPAVAARVDHLRGGDRRGVGAATVRAHERLDVLGRDRVEVATEDEHVVVRGRPPSPQ